MTSVRDAYYYDESDESYEDHQDQAVEFDDEFVPGNPIVALSSKASSVPKANLGPGSTVSAKVPKHTTKNSKSTKATIPSEKSQTLAEKKRITSKVTFLSTSSLDHISSSSAQQLSPVESGADVPTISSNKTVEETYQKKTQLEHILLRPDTYIGSVEKHTELMWVYDEEVEGLIHKQIDFVPGFYKIFDEILVNAADHKIRDPTMDTLKVTIDKANGMISVYNNGRGIPVQIHANEGVYVPELIFGHLLTSSNYDDTEKKVTGGRNGFGAKLCNIFSKEFVIETADSASHKTYKQIFRNNMSEKSDPVIINSSKDDYTKVTFRPDFSKFHLTCIDDDHEALLKKRVYDLAGTVKQIKVYLNDKRIQIKSFKEYVEAVNQSRQKQQQQQLVKEATDGVAVCTPPPPPIIYENVNPRWEVAVSISEGQFQHISFVNRICTSKGGTHVTYVVDQIVQKLAEIVNKKNKAAPVKPFQIRNHLSVFINCLIENPSFDSQTKENMTLRVSAFGSKCDLSDEFIKKVLKSGVVESILDFAQRQQSKELKKTDGSKTSRISGIAKLDDANRAGTRDGSACTLILTEGDSAKALAVSGLSVIGRDLYGVFPLRGKLLNVREATHKQIMENQEINHLKQILGLQQGKVYDDTHSLRYGHLMIMTDQDHDGSHIKGLLINMFDHFWPSLLRIPGFLLEFITPIVKAMKGKQEISFFTIPEYESWKESHDQGKGWTIKYYKGLGTSTSAEAKKYFSDLAKHRKQFSICEVEDREGVDLAFSKKKVDERKEWLRQFRPGTYMDHSATEISVSDFIHKELILFSMADNVRSIPSMVDGLKPGQRKILFSCFKRNLKNEIKVAQLAGYVAEHSAYHHGEQSLCATIINMAQNFVGSNNLNLLEPNGQFGTRIQGGKDAASPRYVFTNLSPITRILFHQDDDPLLNYQNEDGQKIEPDWYIPVLPMVLVNGGEGIGSGWSTTIPMYNPRDIIANLYRLMEEKDRSNDEMCSLLDMHPWYRHFKGSIERIATDKYKVTGIVNRIDDKTIEITELPIGVWTQSYKEFLEVSMQKETPSSIPLITDYKEYHTDTMVHFVVYLTEEMMRVAEQEGLEKRFKLTSTLCTSNMVCFDAEGRIKKYLTAEALLRDFYDLRLAYYQKRKFHLAEVLTAEWTKLDNKSRFIMDVVEGRLIVSQRKREELLEELERKGFAPIFKSSLAKETTADSPYDPELENSTLTQGKVAHSDSSHRGYDYLMSMPIWSLTWERVQQLQKEKDSTQQQLRALLALTPKCLWRQDLDQFLAEWEALEQQDEEQQLQVPPSLTSGKSRKRVTKSTTTQIAEKDTIKPLSDSIRNQTPNPISVLPSEENPLAPLKTVKTTIEDKKVVARMKSDAPKAKNLPNNSSMTKETRETDVFMSLAERISQKMNLKASSNNTMGAEHIIKNSSTSHSSNFETDLISSKKAANRLNLTSTKKISSMKTKENENPLFVTKTAETQSSAEPIAKKRPNRVARSIKDSSKSVQESDEELSDSDGSYKDDSSSDHFEDQGDDDSYDDDSS